MALCLSAVLADNSCSDYCIGLEVSDNILAGLFNSSNSVALFDLPSATLAGKAAFPDLGVVKGMSWLDGPSMAICGSTRSIALFDTRCSEQTGSANSQNTENFAIDYSTNHLAVGGNK